MKERQILFNGEMVRALLDGRKTVTRRVLKMPKNHGNGLPWLPWKLGAITSPHPKKDKWGIVVRREIWKGSGKYELDVVPCPYGSPGDRLWVRETIRKTECFGEHSIYTADGSLTIADSWPWKRDALPSIHCPRGLSRITLEITGVRVERVQEITIVDALAEGTYWGENRHPTPVHAFESLWDSINGKDKAKCWDANPWVWVVEFKVVE